MKKNKFPRKKKKTHKKSKFNQNIMKKTKKQGNM